MKAFSMTFSKNSFLKLLSTDTGFSLQYSSLQIRGGASAAARVVLQAKGSSRVVTAGDTPVPCLAASVADVSKGAGALSVALTLVIEVVAHVGWCEAPVCCCCVISTALPAAGEGRAAHSGWRVSDIAGRVGFAIEKTESLTVEAAPSIFRAVASLVPGLLTVAGAGSRCCVPQNVIW